MQLSFWLSLVVVVGCRSWLRSVGLFVAYRYYSTGRYRPEPVNIKQTNVTYQRKTYLGDGTSSLWRQFCSLLVPFCWPTNDRYFVPVFVRVHCAFDVRVLGVFYDPHDWWLRFAFWICQISKPVVDVVVRKTYRIEHIIVVHFEPAS
jgi:hypothetical protein